MYGFTHAIGSRLAIIINNTNSKLHYARNRWKQAHLLNGRVWSFFLGSGRSFSDFASYRLLRALSALLQFYSTYLFVHLKKNIYIFIYSIGSSNKQGNMSLPAAICLTVINNGWVVEWLTHLNFPCWTGERVCLVLPDKKSFKKNSLQNFPNCRKYCNFKGKNKRVKVNERLKSKPYCDGSNCWSEGQLQVKQ